MPPEYASQYAVTMSPLLWIQHRMRFQRKVDKKIIQKIFFRCFAAVFIFALRSKNFFKELAPGLLNCKVQNVNSENLNWVMEN